MADAGEPHTPARFRRWVLNDYCPGPARSRLSWITAPPAVVPGKTPLTLRVRCENRSDTAWQMKPGRYAGIHVQYAVFGDGVEHIADGRAGLRFETVPPGGGTEVPIPLPILGAGRYRLVVEIHDATGAGIAFRTQAFTKFGDDSLVTEFVVR